MSGVFPVGGRRLVVFVLFDRRGAVEEYVRVALRGVREHASRVLVVVNGVLSAEGLGRLEGLADEVLVRENRGFDVGAFRDALVHVGEDLAGFDEVLLTNDTWFGPVGSFDGVFARMDAREVDFWGLTDHAQAPDPFSGEGVVPYHLQSYWVAVRSGMFLSEAWREYWAALPEAVTYEDAVRGHEVVFTEWFSRRGFVSGVAFPVEGFPSENPSLFCADLLVEAGCPVVKRRVFFQWPPFLDRHAITPRWIVQSMVARGYDPEPLWADLAREIAPRSLNAAASMLEILPGEGAGYDPARPLRVVAIAHVYYPEMTAEIVDRLAHLPGRVNIVLTTADSHRAGLIATELERRGGGEDVEVRVAESNDGRDQSAFLIACRDLLRRRDYDLVVKLHSKKTPQDGYAVGRHFARQQFDNLLPDAGHAADLVGLFQREPRLGLVFPPMIHIGYNTLGHAWWANREPFERLAESLGIHVPIDDVSPLAPFGSMFVARPEALRLMTEHDWSYADFGGAEAYRDGSLAHVLERLPAYAAGELGFHTRTVATPRYLEVSHTSLEYTLDRMAEYLPGDAWDQATMMRTVGSIGDGGVRDLARLHLRLKRPALLARVRRLREWIRGRRR